MNRLPPSLGSCVAGLLITLLCSTSLGTEATLKVLIIDGHAGFHGVREATQAFRTMLLQTDRNNLESLRQETT